jgi:NAD(P)-dependent dehydrogenase (short-subunit alcohol dehydrogenase family)
MAEAWSSKGVNVNALAPGFFPTELTESVFADPVRSNRNAQQTCIGRNGKENDL